MKVKKIAAVLQMATTILAVIYMMNKPQVAHEPAIHHSYTNPEY